MSSEWVTTQVVLKYMLSDLAVYKYKTTLKMLPFKSFSDNIRTEEVNVPGVALVDMEKGYFIRSLPLSEKQPVYKEVEQHIYYIPEQFSRYYIDLRQSFESYSSKFSSKTRSTIKRKVKKFAKLCDGNMHWKKYKTSDELAEFYKLAREVSSKSYQEKLLNSGLPASEGFQKKMGDMAEDDKVRGYLLFDDAKPVAYMYCPINDGTLLYQYLGYDPDYLKWSVGTILHWYAFEDIFNEGKFKYFDFTEGQSEHKRLYSTGSQLCGNVYIFPKTLKNKLLLQSHNAMNQFSKMIGKVLDKFNLKAKIKKILRFHIR